MFFVRCGEQRRAIPLILTAPLSHSHGSTGCGSPHKPLLASRASHAPAPSYGDANIWKYVRDQLEVVGDATGKDVRVIVIRYVKPNRSQEIILVDIRVIVFPLSEQ